MTGDRLLRDLTPLVLCLHLACGVAPRAMVFSHHHHGDEHDHVHAWGADALADDDEHDHDVLDDHPPLADHEVALEDDDHHHHHPDHVHTQSPYPLAARTPVAQVVAIWRVVPAFRSYLPRSPSRRLVPTAARGPPSVPA